MKSEIKFPILNSEKFSKEIMSDLIDSLDKLETIQKTIFNRLNTSLNERINKLCNIKSRINRANKIISNFPKINEAITLKSSFHYPTKNHNYYIPSIIDKNAISENKEPVLRLNRIVLNEKIRLGSKSLAAKDKIILYDKYLGSATQFDDFANELNKVALKEAALRKSLKEFQPILNNFISDFTFGTNIKIDIAKKEPNLAQEINIKNSKDIIQEILKEKEEENQKRKKTIQEAPKSILEKIKIKERKKKKKKLKTEKPKLNINIPTKIGLGGIYELEGGDDDYNDEEEEKIEEKKEEEEEEDEDEDFKDGNEILNYPQFDEEDNAPLPIDYIRQNNESKYEANKVTPTQQYNTNNYQKSVYNVNSNVNSYSNQNPPQQSNNISNSNPQPIQQKVPNPPPAIPSSSTVVVIAGSSGAIPPPPPPPPPPPIVPTIPSKTNETEKNDKANDGPKLSLEEELANAVKGLKKTVKIDLKPKPQALSMAEQIALKRKNLKPVSGSPPKKIEVKTSPKDLLKLQIQMRFNQLNQNEKENNDEDEEDDNF